MPQDYFNNLRNYLNQPYLNQQGGTDYTRSIGDGLRAITGQNILGARFTAPAVTPTTTQIPGPTGPSMLGSPVDLYSSVNDGTPAAKPPTEIGNQSLTDVTQSANQRYLADVLKDIDLRQSRTSMAYSDMYKQAEMSKARRGGLSDTTGFTGGMQAQYRDRVGAAELAQYLQMGGQREMAMQQFDLERQQAPMAAMMREQQEFAMQAERQNQFVGLANNYFQMAEAAAAQGNTDAADSYREQADYYTGLANQVGSALGTLAGGPAKKSDKDDITPTKANTIGDVTFELLRFDQSGNLNEATIKVYDNVIDNLDRLLESESPFEKYVNRSPERKDLDMLKILRRLIAKPGFDPNNPMGFKNKNEMRLYFEDLLKKYS